MSNQPEPNLKQEFMKDFQQAQKDFPTMGKTKQVGVGKFGLQLFTTRTNVVFSYACFTKKQNFNKPSI